MEFSCQAGCCCNQDQSYDHPHQHPSITFIQNSCCIASQEKLNRIHYLENRFNFNPNQDRLLGDQSPGHALNRQEMLFFYALNNPLFTTSFELDTADLCKRIKETMLINGISQRVFSQAVLNLSQGTLSDLLNKPKPWHTLSFKGKRPYVCMHIWLSDPLRFQKINQWNSANQSSKKSESTPFVEIKRKRFHFSSEQKKILLQEFTQNCYPKMIHMKYLAEKLSLDTKSVIIWFHNQRTRNKRRYLALNSAIDNQQQQCPFSFLNPSTITNASTTPPTTPTSEHTSP